MTNGSSVEVEGGRSQEVIARLKSLTHDQIKPLLDARHEADPVAGIAIAHLTDKSLSKQIRELIISTLQEFLRAPLKPQIS